MRQSRSPNRHESADASRKPAADAFKIFVADIKCIRQGRNENVSALFPFWLVFILARFVQFTASQTVVGRLAYLTVMPAFVIRSTIPSPE